LWVLALVLPTALTYWAMAGYCSVMGLVVVRAWFAYRDSRQAAKAAVAEPPATQTTSTNDQQQGE
jgi:hypothetical protein